VAYCTFLEKKKYNFLLNKTILKYPLAEARGNGCINRSLNLMSPVFAGEMHSKYFKPDAMYKSTIHL